MLPRFADLESRLTLRKDREMSALEIWLPGCILVLAFVLKLFVDRVAGVPDFIAALIELPVDIAFLAISLVAAFTISPSTSPTVPSGRFTPFSAPPGWSSWSRSSRP